MSKKIKIIENIEDNSSIIFDIKNLIEESKMKVAFSINEEISNLYWKIGKCINDKILKNKRAQYVKVFGI